jgi:hypothetical protein
MPPGFYLSFLLLLYVLYRTIRFALGGFHGKD